MSEILKTVPYGSAGLALLIELFGTVNSPNMMILEPLGVARRITCPGCVQIFLTGAWGIQELTISSWLGEHLQ